MTDFQGKYYMTAAEYLDILQMVLEEVFQFAPNTQHHPEDLFINMQTSGEAINVALRELMRRDKAVKP